MKQGLCETALFSISLSRRPSFSFFHFLSLSFLPLTRFLPALSGEEMKNEKYSLLDHKIFYVIVLNISEYTEFPFTYNF